MAKNPKYVNLGNQSLRFEKASKIIIKSRLRNKPATEGGSFCPILVEGIRDEKALRVLGFTGIIEKLNRGHSRSRIIAHLYESYGKTNSIDGKSPIIVLMDWDKTGYQIQEFFRDRMMSMDVTIDEEMHSKLSKLIKPEIITVESLSSFSNLVLLLDKDDFL